MLKNRDDIDKLMCCFDVFALTSLFEGLPIVAIEAQASGLPCVFSDTITKQVKLSNNVKFVSLRETAARWAEIILEYKAEKRSDNREILTNKGYNIKEEAKKLENFYLNVNKS